jgi:hypothetical protein
MCSGALAAWRARMRSLHTYPTLATALAAFARAARSAVAQQVPAPQACVRIRSGRHVKSYANCISTALLPAAKIEALQPISAADVHCFPLHV